MRKTLMALLLALVVMLTACGSPGGSSTPDSKWDSATFDSSTWK